MSKLADCTLESLFVNSVTNSRLFTQASIAHVYIWRDASVGIHHTDKLLIANSKKVPLPELVYSFQAKDRPWKPIIKNSTVSM